MRKLICIVAIACLCILSGYAQNAVKYVVNVGAFTYGKTAFTSVEALTVRDNVMRTLHNANRVHVVDLGQQEEINTEAERRKAEAALGDYRDVADITQLKANYILNGMLNNISVTKGQTLYNAKLTFSVTLTDVSNGTIHSSVQYESLGSGSTATEARNNAISRSAETLNKFIEDAFPVTGTILQVVDVDAKKPVAKTVYIDLGSDDGMQPGQFFSVYAIVDVAGEKGEAEIGALQAKTILSGSRTLCKVTKGGDIILQKLNAKEEMFIKTRTANGGIFNKWLKQ